MAIARLHPEHSIGGTGNVDQGLARSRGKFGRETLRIARMVLRHAPELADQVTQGAITLKKAWLVVQKNIVVSDDNETVAYTHVEGHRNPRYTGQKAMALAMRFPGGIWRGDAEARKYVESGGFCYDSLKRARRVLRCSPELAHSVLRGDTLLSAATAMVRRAAREAQRLRMLQAAGRFQMQQYVRPRGLF
jgi:hypothetical protein